MSVAVAKYPVGEPRDFEAFVAKQAQLLREASVAGAPLALLPEHLALELAALFEGGVRGACARGLERALDHVPAGRAA